MALPKSIADFRRRLMLLSSVAIIGIAGSARAEQPTTHHFLIVRPSVPVVVGAPVEFEITARMANNKINKKADNDLIVQTTSGEGPRSQTLSKDASLKHGVARVTLAFQDVGPTILQVTDKSNTALTNSTAVTVLPQPRARGVRP